MANKKTRQRISYVLPLSNRSDGHRLGVNGLAVDSDNSILYSGGRDGLICAWNLNVDLKTAKYHQDRTTPAFTSQQFTEFRSQIEAHTHWVNDVVLTKNSTAIISASSDSTVKVWRPLSSETGVSHTIGQHSDYVKCVATPGCEADWVASGGLDRKVCIWDLNGSGKRLEIEARDEERAEKGSIYALASSHSILASGGPESIVRLWDPRSGSRITKFVGHTDNIRDILIEKNGDKVVTASSDQTIKIWSLTACRCIRTLTIHNESVWSLFSDDPSLKTIYSCDRSGLIVKTSFQGSLGDIDGEFSLALAQENEGVNKLIASGSFIWTATSSSSINRWLNVDPISDVQMFENYFIDANTQEEPLKQENLAQSHDVDDSLISTSNGTPKRSVTSSPVPGCSIPTQAFPQETIEGQYGLLKHKILNDRRRVLTLDTAGDVLLWDLLNCIPIKSFGKRNLEDVEPEVNTLEAVAPWCSIDTHTGRLAVILEENNCFDAEVYADEMDLVDTGEFREDQRINLGKWILRYILSGLLEELIEKDELFRKELLDKTVTSSDYSPKASKSNFPPSIKKKDSLNGIYVSSILQNNLHGVPENEAVLDNNASLTSHESRDHRSSGSISGDTNTRVTVNLSGAEDNEKLTSILNETEKEAPKEGNTFFGKKFRKGMSFGSRKNRPVSSPEKPVAPFEKNLDSSENSENADKEHELDDSFGGVVQRIRMEYKKNVLENKNGQLESGITPSQPGETPTLKLPPMTTIIIQGETSGGSVDLYRGTVATIGKDAHIIEEKAPMWLGELLLKNKIPPKEPVKVSFILQPWKDILPSIAGPDGNARLNANRMLRVKKILAYIAERISSIPGVPNAKELKPEEYLGLYCYDQKLPTSMTLATLRAHVWKGGADVVLYYKSQQQSTK
ncbi:UBP9-binding protein bun107 [Golovinomyces cichoracearum]|uniref:UBP9-binding protein bun107 n=1 Tax=Golovinomyces cichoracearum TaxID=62708 RepID=A0A420IIC3_9PEZI|nr:UBP9-binding protein bun107 [Golovinomyces cichoracearum]